MVKSEDIKTTGFKVLMENDKVRVLDFKVGPGEKTPQHSHPDTVVCILNDQNIRFIYPDGGKKEMGLKADNVVWIDAETHIVENIGETEAHDIVIELKK